MTCAECSSRMDTIDSRNEMPGVVRRRRCCRGCGARITTYEIEVPADHAVVLRRLGGRVLERRRLALIDPMPLYAEVKL